MTLAFMHQWVSGFLLLEQTTLVVSSSFMELPGISGVCPNWPTKLKDNKGVNGHLEVPAVVGSTSVYIC